MAQYSTHKSTAEGKAESLRRKAARQAKRTGLYNPQPAVRYSVKGA